MLPTTSLPADEALRLINGRLDGFRAEALATSAGDPVRSLSRAVRGLVGRIQTAIREIDERPTMRLTEYPFRA